LAVGPSANGCRPSRAHEGAHEFAIHLGGDRVDIDALCAEETTSFFHAIHPRWFNINLLDTGPGGLSPVIVFLLRPAKSQDPNFNRGV
jgi:hypothetical protein